MFINCEQVCQIWWRCAPPFLSYLRKTGGGIICPPSSARVNVGAQYICMYLTIGVCLQAHVSHGQSTLARSEAIRLLHRLHGHHTGGRQTLPLHLPQVRDRAYTVQMVPLHLPQVRDRAYTVQMVPLHQPQERDIYCIITTNKWYLYKPSDIHYLSYLHDTSA